MQPRDLAHHVQPEAGAAVLRRKTIERIEYPRALIPGNAVAFVRHVDGRGAADMDRDGAAPAAMLDRILHEIGQRALQRGAIALRLDPIDCSLERQFITGRDRKRREVGGDIARDRDEIDALERIAALVEALDVEQLLGERRQPRRILEQSVFSGPGGSDSSRVLRIAIGVRNSCAASATKRWWRE